MLAKKTFRKWPKTLPNWFINEENPSEEVYNPIWHEMLKCWYYEMLKLFNYDIMILWHNEMMKKLLELVGIGCNFLNGLDRQGLAGTWWNRIEYTGICLAKHCFFLFYFSLFLYLIFQNSALICLKILITYLLSRTQRMK